jgi:Domain of unknown function (DUF1996)
VVGVKTGWIVLVVSVLAVAAVGGAGAARKPRDMKQLAGVNFISSCRFSHRAPDDPIVYPGLPGLSHDHSFVGNDTTNAFSTVDSLRAGSTSCRRAGDTAAYWMPTLLQNGNPVAPTGATIYYRRRTLDRVRAFPPGLKMIAGDSKALTPQSMRITYWNCGVQAGLPPSNSVPTCPVTQGSSLRLHVTFPSCWDGKNLDSADHKSHMAYAMGGACPATQPVAVPAISLIYRYPILGGPGITLSSGGQFSAHADFFNAWNQGLLERLTNRCLNALRHCAQGGPRG